MSDNRELLNLKKQFFSAMGSNVISDNYEGFDSEFLAWTKQRLNLLGDYICILEEMGYDFQGENTAEIAKSAYDSAVIPFETKIITPYTENFERATNELGGNRVESATFIVLDGSPLLLSTKNGDIKSLDDNIDTIITHNPYDDRSIKNWDQLHNSGNYNITIGLYGNTYDRDISQKIAMLKGVKQLLTDDSYREEYYTIRDKYFYIFGTDRNQYKVRTRKNN